MSSDEPDQEPEEDKVVCFCTKCGGLRGPISTRTVQRHAKADKERASSRITHGKRARGRSESPTGSNPRTHLPSPPRARRRQPLPLFNPGKTREASPLFDSGNMRESSPLFDPGNMREPSPLFDPGDMRGPSPIPSNDGSADGNGEGGAGEGERDEEQDARIAAALLENLRIRDQNIGDGNGGDGDEDEDDEMDLDGAAQLTSSIEDIRITDEFIQLLKSATLDNDALDEHTLHRLRNPITHLPENLDSYQRLAIDLYLSITQASEATYNTVRDAILRCFPESKLLSYHEVKKLIADITGVVAVKHDMCINSCHAYTGPFKDLEICWYCHEPRYNQDRLQRNGDKVPCQQFSTILLGPQLAAIRRSSEGANARKYRDKKLTEIYTMIDDLAIDPNTAGGNGMIYDDIWCGNDVLELVEKINMTEDDVAISSSLDGAQLYQNKKSDCWIGIWINQDYAPDVHFKKKKILPNLTIPGPNKPKHTDSFLFPGLHHLSALQRENDGRGIHVWDASKARIVCQRTVYLLTLADAIGLVEVDGRVGHHGAQGCRIGCPMKGRHKCSSGHYYAAHARPLVVSVENNQHPDTDIRDLPPQSTEAYEESLKILRDSPDQTSYKRNRKRTGLSKPSIFSGLHPDLSLPVPRCFGLDLMHLFLLNLTELLLCLWRGTMKCEPTDDKATWDWVKLVGQTWEDHGETVASATQYFPSSFQRPPRNPALKLSSGYKATEYYLYVFGLGPGLFRPILPTEYWENFCKLSASVRTLLQWSIADHQLADAKKLLVEFSEKFEELYYQRREDRLHFCRPCIHVTVAHAADEVFRLGPGVYSTQFAMERTIGDLGQEVKQPSNPFANLAERALRRAQVNALKVMHPEIDADTGYTLPRYSREISEGLVLLRPRERRIHRCDEAETALLRDHLDINCVRRWGRLRLPNGQIARSRFVELDLFRKRKPRVTRNVKLRVNGITEFGEIWYYFMTEHNHRSDSESDTDADEVSTKTYAMISLYGRPDRAILAQSSRALWACEYLGSENLHIVRVEKIRSVVSMIPLPALPGEEDGRWFVVEKPGIDSAIMTGHEEDMNAI